MAEKVTIAEINIDYDTAITDAQKLKGEIGLLSSQLKTAKKATGDTSEETIKYEAALRQTKKELREQNKFIDNLTVSTDKNTGTTKKLTAQNAILRKEQSQLNLTTEKGIKRNSEINIEINKNTRSLQDNSDEFVVAKRNVGNYDDRLSSLSPTFSKVSNGAKAVGVSLKFMLAPIALIVAGIAAMTAYFKRSEEGQNKLAKITRVLSVVFENLMDIVSNIGEALYNAITSPREAWESFKDMITGVGDYFENTFGNIIMGSLQGTAANFSKFVANIQLGWAKLVDVFSDNSDGIAAAQDKIALADEKLMAANERVELGIKNTTDSIKNGYESAINSIKSFNTEMETEIGIAMKLADMQAELDKRERDNIILTAQERLKLEQLKNQIEDKNNKTAQERLSLLDEENALLDEQLERRLTIAQDVLKIKEVENSLSMSTKEDLMEETNLRAELYNLEAEIEGKRREAITKRQEVERELAASIQAEAAKQIEVINSEIEAWRASNEAKLLITEEFNAQLLEIQLQALATQHEQGLIAQSEYLAAQQEAQILYEENEDIRKQEIELTKAELRAEQQQETALGALIFQGEQLDKQRDQEIAYANKIGADVEAIERKYARKSIDIEASKAQLIIGVAQQLTDAIADAAGENTKVAKAAAISSAIITTLLSSLEAFRGMVAAIPGPVGLIAGGVAAAAMQVTGAIQVARIAKTSTDIKSSSSSSVPSFSKPSVSVGSAASTQPETVSTDVGNGIVQRNSDEQTSQSTNVLVVDEVTAAQNSQSEQDIISTL